MEERNSKLNTADKAIKMIYFLAYILWNLFLIIVNANELYESIQQKPLTDGDLGYVFTFLILGVVYGGIGNLIIACIALIGLFVAICNKGNPNRKKSIITYVLLILLPIITEALIVLGGLYIPEWLL